MTVGVGAEAWALPIGVPPGVVAVALAAVVMREGGYNDKGPARSCRDCVDSGSDGSGVVVGRGRRVATS